MVHPVVTVSSYISGCGMAVPNRVVTNEHFESYLDTNDDWIRERTGIIERRWADKDSGVSGLAAIAAKEALENAKLSAKDIDGIVFGTSTPDAVFPSSACYLQKYLGISRGLAFDVNAACSGFVYALITANSLIADGLCNHVLVVGADVLSRVVDINDRSTCILFGDGAGVVVLSRADRQLKETPQTALQKPGRSISGKAGLIRGLYASELCSDGTQTDILYVPDGSAHEPTPESLKRGDHFLKMEGREVFKLAVRSLAEISERVIKKAGLQISDVDFVIAHQANKRILQSMGKHLGVPEEKILVNVDRYGNTSAASVPILLAEAAARGTIKKGDILLLNAFGGGLTWGASVVCW